MFGLLGTHKAGWEPAAQRFSQGRPGITVHFWRGHRDPDRESERERDPAKEGVLGQRL